MDDSELLDRYGRDGDQEAFAKLVRRHSEWIYPSARRQLRDAHLAEDVTQAVFLLLARKAAGIAARSNLGGWLFGTLRYCVKEAGRQRSREHERVKEAAQMKQDIASEANWELISPLLDGAIGQLRKSDREAVLLRFYQRKPLAEVGRLLGISEDAARMRVDRAVEKLRGMLETQGVTGTSAGLSAVLVGNVVQEVPTRVVEGVMSALRGGGGSVVAGGIAQGAAKMMDLVKVKVGAAVVAAVVLVAGVGAGVAGSSTRPASGPVAAVPGFAGSWETTEPVDTGPLGTAKVRLEIDPNGGEWRVYWRGADGSPHGGMGGEIWKSPDATTALLHQRPSNTDLRVELIDARTVRCALFRPVELHRTDR